MCIHCTYTCRQINTPSQSPNKMGVKMKSNFHITKHFQIAAKSPSQPVFYSKLLHKCPPPAPTTITNSYLRPKNISRLSLQVFHQKWAPWKARNAPEITISASWNGAVHGAVTPWSAVFIFVPHSRSQASLYLSDTMYSMSRNAW